MPRADKKYLSHNKQQISSGQGLSSGGLLLNRTANLRAAHVQAPQVQASKVTPVQLQHVDNTKVIAHVTAQLGKTAILLADRQASAEALEANNAFTGAVRELWLGKNEEDGSFTPGYASTKSKTGYEAHQPFQQAIGKARNSIASGLGDSARAKFLAQSNGTYQNTLNSAAQHAAGSLQQYEKEGLAQQQQSFYQSLDDMLLQESPQAIDAMIQDHLTNLSTTWSVSPDKLPAVQQKMFKDMGSFVASQGNPQRSVAKLEQIKMQLGGSFDIDTATHYGNLKSTLIAKAEREREKAVARTDRAMAQARTANADALMVQSLEDPLSINLSSALTLVKQGKLSSSMYLALENRQDAKTKLPSITPEKEDYLKTQLQYGEIDEEEYNVQISDYNTSSRKQMMTFSRSLQNTSFKAYLNYGYDSIEDSILLIRTPAGKRKARLTRKLFYQWLQKNIDNPNLDTLIETTVGTMLQNFDPDPTTTEGSVENIRSIN